ncbi:MAG: cystathionine beta-synthase [Bacteroidota bacterium]
MKVYDNILQTIGNTPLVKLNNLNEGIDGTILVKVEYFNPGQSVKDRIALKMIEDAERKGLIKPGGTIIEGTSGNTGMGLALAAIVKGYNCIFTTTDKQSISKVNLLRALGAEVKICPTNVEPDDPRSYYSVAKRLSEEIPNSYYPNQYDNPSNAQAHYETTGPEIWDQTEGKVTHYVAGMGTGGTVTGTSRYLKEQNPDIQTIGIDSVGSVYKHYFETGEFSKEVIEPYLTEGIGEDIIPGNVDMDLIDAVVQVNDKDAFLTTRALAKREGLFVGGSCGAAVHGALEYAKENLNKDDVMVIILPDTGTRYVSKIFNDEWMQQNGFLDASATMKAHDILKKRDSDHSDIITVSKDDTLGEAVDIMNQKDISQLPVMDGDEVVGSLNENQILSKLLDDPGARSASISSMMQNPFPVITGDMRIDQITKMLTKENPAVIIKKDDGSYDILTRSDLIQALSHINDN